MTHHGTGRSARLPSAASTLAQLFEIAGAPWRRLVASTALGTAAAAATIALMACSGALIDRAAQRPALYTLTVLMAAVQLLALCRAPLRYGERLVSHDAALRSVSTLRLWLYDVLEPRLPAALGRWQRGDLLAAATGDLRRVEGLYQRSVAPLIVAVASALVATAVEAAVCPAAGLVLGAGLVVALGASCSLAWARGRGSGSREALLRADLASVALELIEGAPDLIAYGATSAYLDRVQAGDAALTTLARRRAWTAGLAGSISVAVLGATVVGLGAVGIPAVSAHRMPAFMLAVLPLVALGAFDVVRPAADAVRDLPEDLAAARRLTGVTQVPVPVADPVHPAPAVQQFDLAVDRLSLRYAADAPWALDGVSFSVPSGSMVALVGESGAGKTSVVHALLRFWSAEHGTVSIGGVPSDQLAQSSVRAAMGWVAQDSHLFHTSIRANIALARPDATDDEILAAARTAQLGPWIDSLPAGIETPVGEAGALVSGGQRQRIALARAVLAGPRVLMLDEPTAGLDHRTGERLLRDLLAAADGRTVLLITHREEELRHADAVVRLREGRVLGGAVRQ